MVLAEDLNSSADEWLADLPCGLRLGIVGSLTDGLQETPILFADLPRFLEGTDALFFKATKVALNVTDVELEVFPNDVGVVSHSLRVTRDEWARRGDTGFGGGVPGQEYDKQYSLCATDRAQPEVIEPPYFLDQLHENSLSVG